MKQIVKILSAVFLLILAAGCGSSSSNSAPTPTSDTETDTAKSKTETQNINEIKSFFGDEFEIISKDCDEAAGIAEANARRPFNNPIVGFTKDVGNCRSCTNHMIYQLFLNEKAGIKYVEIKWGAPLTDNNDMGIIRMYNPEWKFKDGKLHVSEGSDFGFYMYKDGNDIFLYSKTMDKASKVDPSYSMYIPSQLPYCGI